MDSSNNEIKHTILRIFQTHCTLQKKKSRICKTMAVNQSKVDEELFQAQAHLYKHIFNFMGSMFLKCALKLNIPDIIHRHGQPITLPELLYALQIDTAKSSNLYRLMRLLVHSGFFSTTKVTKNDHGEEEVGYDLTPFSRILVKDNISCLSSFAQFLAHQVVVHSSECLGDWFRSNDEPTPFYTAHGMGFWDFVGQNQEFSRFFNESMIGDSSMMCLVMKDYCKLVFEGFDTLVDVGGGNGSASRILAEKFPNMECIVLDLPHAVENLQDNGNLKFVGADMLEFIPPADSYLFKV